jgi:hypothetical protein
LLVTSSCLASNGFSVLVVVGNVSVKVEPFPRKTWAQTADDNRLTMSIDRLEIARAVFSLSSS